MFMRYVLDEKIRIWVSEINQKANTFVKEVRITEHLCTVYTEAFYNFSKVRIGKRKNRLNIVFVVASRKNGLDKVQKRSINRILSTYVQYKDDGDYTELSFNINPHKLS